MIKEKRHRGGCMWHVLLTMLRKVRIAVLPRPLKIKLAKYSPQTCVQCVRRGWWCGRWTTLVVCKAAWLVKIVKEEWGASGGGFTSLRFLQSLLQYLNAECACVCMCACVRAYVCVCKHSEASLHWDFYSTWMLMCVCVCAYVRVCMHVCVRMCVQA